MAALSHGPSGLFVSDSNEDQWDDDSISVTSTVVSEHGSEEEFVVDAVLAERETENDGTQYLIKWENYPMDRSTWEGVENLSEELRQQWHEQREQEKMGQRRAFDLRIYENAIVTAVQNRMHRHMLRNTKRQRLNLPMTEPFPPEYTEFTGGSADAGEVELNDELFGIECSLDTSTDVELEQTISKEAPTSNPTQPAQHNTSSDESVPCSGQALSAQKTPLNTSVRTLATGWQGTARKPSGTTTTRPLTVTSTKHPSTSSTLAAKFGKRLKATRTANPKPLLQRSGAASMASSTQKARKPRTTLKEAMMDPTRPPKLMTNLRGVNILLKKGRELNDGAPADPSAIPAGYFITSNPAQRKLSNDTSVPSAAATTGSDTLVPAAMAPSASSQKVRVVKKVRFAEHIVSIERSESPISTGSPNVRSGPPVKKVSLQTYQQRSVFQTITKTVAFGFSKARKLPVEFHDMPRAASNWLSHFLGEDVIHFRTVCTSIDFFSGNTVYDIQDSQAKLAIGDLRTEVADQAALETVASNLRMTSSALYMAYPGFSILVFPDQCPAWASLAGKPSTPDSSESSGSALMYLIFRARLLLHPEHYPTLSSGSTMSDAVNSAALRIQLMSELATLDYDNLLASSAGEKHVFFLLFHPADSPVFQALSLWLRACRPDCYILHNQEPGGWEAYREETRSTKSGAVIVHKSVEKSVRNIPKLWDLLKHGAHTFWSFSSSDHKAELRPLAPNSHVISGIPKQLKLTQLFPAGRVFLLTPSFVTSLPRKLCTFLEWFKRRAAYAPCALVVCAGFSAYLFDLAMGKARERRILLQKYSDNSIRESRASEQGLSLEDQDYRARAWELFSELSDPSYCGFKSYEEPAEDIRKIVWVDDLIAPDDEQSLVHWFASWSMTRLDSYRKFYILGSSSASIEKAHRMVRVPNYMDGTVNDPDTKNREVDSSASPGRNEFRSHMFRGDRPCDFFTWFDQFESLKGTSSFWMFFSIVGWLDLDMADRYGDQFAKYATYKQWLSACPRFWKKVNTLLGLFYTTEGGNETKQSTHLARHPWVALLRPVNPHLDPDAYSAMELLIWDCTVKDRPGAARQLLPMQQSLVDFVRSELPKKHYDYHLERVFIGGWNIDVDADPSCPIDVTCKMIEAIVEGKHGRAKYVPPRDNYLFEAGWKLVNENVPETGSQFPKIPADADEPERLIFHPPRGESWMAEAGSKSACTNDLYDSALRARKRDPNCETFFYQYRPTVQWYQVLKEEKRFYNHIQADSWDRIFKDAKINIED